LWRYKLNEVCNRIEEWKVEKILNKKKIRGVEKYLIRWKGFMAEGDTWKRREFEKCRRID